VACDGRVLVASACRRLGQVRGNGHLHGDSPVIAAVAISAASALASVLTSAGADRPPLALSASPTRIVVASGAWSAVRVTNAGRSSVVVDVSPAGFALDPRGRPRIAATGAAKWLVVSPRRLALGQGVLASVTVSAVVPRLASPGEHDALVLLRTRPQARAPFRS
jgi:hypothetical protein